MCVTSVLTKLGLANEPAATTPEGQVINEAVNQLSTLDDKDKRSKGFWKKVGDIALKIAPEVIGIAVGL